MATTNQEEKAFEARNVNSPDSEATNNVPGKSSTSADIQLAERSSEGTTIEANAVGEDDKDGGAAKRANTSTDGGAPAAPVYKVYRRRWFGLMQLTLLNVIVSWDWLTFSPVASDAAAYFQTTESTINWLSTAFMFAFVFILPVVMYVLHFGPRPSMITSAVLVFLGNWIRYAGTRAGRSSDGLTGGHFGVVMFGQILTGLAQPFVLAAPTRYSDMWFTNRGRIAATALTSLANPFGAALGQLIIPFWVYSSKDIPDMILYVSIISTVCSVPSFFVFAKPPTPVAPSSETPKMGIVKSVQVLCMSVEFWLVFIPFSIYVGFFNSVSTLLNQIMLPYGYSDDEAGIGGAVLIVVGLVSAAITSPILDRTKQFTLTFRVCVPIIAVSYLVFIWMPQTHDSGGLAGPYVVLAILGAASFSLVPVAVEFLVEMTHPVSPQVTSALAWGGGQLLGGIFIVISDALRDGDGASPPRNMKRALIFSAVVAIAAAPFPMCLGLFGRMDKLQLRRVRSDLGDHGSSVSTAEV